MTRVDLHTHSTASDGEVDPAGVVTHAATVGIEVIALTDHDTLAGIPIAKEAGQVCGVRVISGCEFSVAVWWGEMHLLGYMPSIHAPELESFLADQQRRRAKRADTMVQKLNELGVPLTIDDVAKQSTGATLGRPHVARALVASLAVPDVATAFDRYIGRGCPAFVAKDLPSLAEVTALVSNIGGVTSAAHLGQRATRTAVARLKDQGVDGIEVRHPSHDDTRAAKIERIANSLDMLLTGGSDWHGNGAGNHHARGMGEVDIPLAWVEALEDRINQRAE